jgi:hypothetical protein
VHGGIILSPDMDSGLASKFFNFKMYIPNWDILITVFYGLVVSDALHWLADILSTAGRAKTTWTTLSDVRNARGSLRSRTGSQDLIQKLIRDAVEN